MTTMTGPLVSDEAVSRFPINEALASSERHNVNSSSNWSITSKTFGRFSSINWRLTKICRLRGSRERSSINVDVAMTELSSLVKQAARLSSGFAVGVRVYICQSADFLFQRKVGIIPARTSEDLPLPEAPTMAMKRDCCAALFEVKERMRSVRLAV